MRTEPRGDKSRAKRQNSNVLACFVTVVVGALIGVALFAMLRSVVTARLRPHGSASAETMVSKARPPPPKASAWLDDAPVLDSATGYGVLGLHGELGYEDRSCVVQGTPCPHAISMHTYAQSSGVGPRAFASFNVADARRGPANDALLAGESHLRFVSRVAIADKNNIFGRAGSPVTFRLLGDGKQLWRSRPIQSTGVIDVADVDVTLVEVLRLEAEAAGSNACSHAVWVDPRLVVPQT